MGAIRILNGPNRNQRYPLNGGEICGRDPGCEIQVFAPGVSRKHFQFMYEGGKIVVNDLNSANGTYVNNVRINKKVLRDKDMIIVGGIQLQFVEESDVGASAAAPTMIGDNVGDEAQSFLRDDEDDEADFDYSVDASMVFTQGTVAAKDVEAANEALKKRLRITYEISQALASAQDSSELLSTMSNKLFEAFPHCGRCLIMLGDNVETLAPVVFRTRNDKASDQVPPVSRTIARIVYNNHRSILTEDASSDPGLPGGGAQMSIVNLQLRSLMCVPLLFQDDCYGFIQLDTQDRQHKFTQEDLNLLTALAGQAAIFLKNVQLLEAVEKEAAARTNLQRYFSPDLANRLITGEIDLKPGGDMKSGTVFFSDIIGFTAMSHRMTAKDVITKINRYFKIMVDTIFRYHGYIDKFGGDAIMAVWGVPVEIKDESHLACTAAIEMQNALYLFNRELIEEGQPDIQMGIGLNYGDFVAGNLGSEQRMEYTVIGDQVNLAQRVESKAGRGNVFISTSVYERTSDRLLVSKLQPTSVKGISEPVTIYSIRGVLAKSKNPADRVFIMTLPFFFENSSGDKTDEGLLVKGTLAPDGRIMALILLHKEIPAGQTEVALRFLPNEAPDFTARFEVQGQGRLQNKFGKLYKGMLDIKGNMLEDLFNNGVYVSDKTPDQMPRSKVLRPQDIPS